MASRYWVGGTATWDGTAGTKWATTSGGAGGSAVPTAADDVFFTNLSTGTCTLSSTSVCRSINCTGFTGTISHPASTNFNIGDGTAGASNVALKFVSGMTYTIGAAATSVIRFISTSGTQQTIDSGTKTLAGLTFDGAGSSYLLSAGFVQNSGSNLTFVNGTINTNNFACTWGTTALSAGTKTITFGSSVITVIGGGLNFGNNGSGFTLNAGTSSLVFNPTGAVSPTFTVASGQTYYDISVIKSAGGFSPTMILVTGTSVTLNNLTMDNTVLGSGNRVLQFTSAVTWNINGTLIYKANSATVARGRLLSGTRGTAATIALGTTGTASLTDIDIEDIIFTGTNTPVVAAGGSRLADGGGNSGITFAAPVNYYWIGGSGSTGAPGEYSATSGGASGTLVPLVHDVVIFDANSFSAPGQIVTNNQMRMPGLDFTNATNNPVYNPINPSGASNAIFGDFILKSGMTISASGAAGGVIPHAVVGRGNYDLDFAGVDMLTTFSLSVVAPNGTYTLQSHLAFDITRTFNVSNGTFDANGFNVTVGFFTSTATTTRAIVMGTGQWTITSSGTTVWNLATVTNLTFTRGTLPIIFSYSGSTGTRTITHTNTGEDSCPSISITAGSDIVSLANARYFDVDFTGFTGNLGTGAFVVWGDMTFGAGMTTSFSTNIITFAATSGNHTITSNGVSIDRYITIGENVGTATWTLQDDLTMTSGVILVISRGTFDANNMDVSTGVFSSSSSNARTIYMGSGTWTLGGTGTVLNFFTTTNLTLNTGTSTILITDTSASTKQLDAPGNETPLYNVTINGGGSGNIDIVNARMIVANNFTVTGPKNIRLGPNASTWKLSVGGNLDMVGSPGNLINITLSSGVTTAINKASGVVLDDYLSLTNIRAVGGAEFYAGPNSVDNGGNTGWKFNAHYLPMNDALHGHLADNAIMVEHTQGILNDAFQNQTVDSVTLAVKSFLGLEDALHGHLVDAVIILTQFEASWDNATLPTDEEHVTNIFTEADYTSVRTDDANYLCAEGEDSANVFVMSNKNYREYPIEVIFKGKSSYNTSEAPVYMQMYNYETDTWDTIATENSTVAETDFTLEAIVEYDLEDYTDDDYTVTARVYQEYA